MEKKDKIVSTWLYKKNPRVALENYKTSKVCGGSQMQSKAKTSSF